MKKLVKENELTLLYMLFATALITCNCIASKLMILPFKLFGQDVCLTSGALVYPITFLITDIIGEKYGKKASIVAVLIGFVCQVISTLLIIVARYIPCSDPTMQDAYVTLLGQTYVFVIASLVAYICSQISDLFVFHKLKEVIMKNKTNEAKYKWIWNNVGTITAQFIDSVIYVSIAFGLGFKWFFNGQIYTLLIMISAQWLVKIIFALLDTPFFYLFTRRNDDE